MTDSDIFNYEQAPMAIRENTADITKYYTFNVLPSETAVWTPAAQKSINLTALVASAPLGVTILLSSGGNTFLCLRPTASCGAISRYFQSPLRLGHGGSIFIRTSDEASSCQIFGASSAAQAAYNGRSDFTNVSNAAGLPNGQYSTLNSALLNATGGRIVLDYSLLAENSEFEIESVTVSFYCRLALTLAVGTSTMILYWRASSSDAWTPLQQLSLSLVGTLNYLTAPLTYDITAAVLAAPDPWAVIDNLQTSFVGSHTGLGLGNTIQLDAVTVEVCLTGNNKITLSGFET